MTERCGELLLGTQSSHRRSDRIEPIHTRADVVREGESLARTGEAVSPSFMRGAAWS